MMNESIKDLENCGQIILKIIFKLDRILYKQLIRIEFNITMYISWILTWFVHDTSDHNSLMGIFDFFMINHALMPFYFVSSVMIIL